MFGGHLISQSPQLGFQRNQLGESLGDGLSKCGVGGQVGLLGEIADFEPFGECHCADIGPQMPVDQPKSVVLRRRWLRPARRPRRY